MRACAGGIADEVHRLSLTARGFESGQEVNWRFEDVTRRDDKGRVLLPPRLWDGENWVENLATRADADGAVKLRIVSGQTAEKPRLVASVGSEIRGQIECDFGAPEMVRRFPEPFIDNDYEWRLPQSDNGYLFDAGLAITGQRENGKVYLKFRLNDRRGDVDGNWRVVNGHRLKVRVAEVSFNDDVFRSDGAKVTFLTAEKDTAPYAFVRDPNNSSAKTNIVTTSGDGSASFVIVAGPKYDVQSNTFPQPVVEAQDLSVYEPPRKTSPPKITPVLVQGAAVEWTDAAAQLRGKLLLGTGKGAPQNMSWKIVSFSANGRHEKPISLQKWQLGGFSLGAPFWSPNGQRFGLTCFGTGNDYMMTFGLFDAEKPAFIGKIAPPYVAWKAFSPDAEQLALARGSNQVVGSGRIGDDYSLHIWNGKSEVKLPVNASFLFSDSADAMVCWRGSHELLVTQEASATTRGTKPQLGVLAVNADGQHPPQPLLSRAWKPLASPDGNLIAFYGPESSRQKPSKYYVVAPLDQALCIARRDGKPLRAGKLGYADRLPLGRFGDAYPELFWSRDSKTLYSVSTFPQSGNSGIDIWSFDVRSGERKRVASWDFEVPQRKVSNDLSRYGWKFSDLSPDGTMLLASFIQSQDDPDSVFMLQAQQWFAVNLSSGTLTKLATMRGTDFA